MEQIEGKHLNSSKGNNILYGPVVFSKQSNSTIETKPRNKASMSSLMHEKKHLSTDNLNSVIKLDIGNVSKFAQYNHAASKVELPSRNNFKCQSYSRYLNVQRKPGSNTECHHLKKCSIQTNSNLKHPVLVRKFPHTFYYSASKSQDAVAPVDDKNMLNTVDAIDGCETEAIHFSQDSKQCDMNSDFVDLTTEQKFASRRAITVTESQNVNTNCSSVRSYPCSNSILKIVQAIKEFGSGDKVTQFSHPQMKRTMLRQTAVFPVSYPSANLMSDVDTKCDCGQTENSLINAKNEENLLEVTKEAIDDGNNSIAAENVECTNSMNINSDYQTGKKMSQDLNESIDRKDCSEDESIEGDNHDLYKSIEDDSRNSNETNYIYIMLSDNEEFDDSNYYNGFEAYLNSKNNSEKSNEAKSISPKHIAEKDLISEEHNSTVSDDGKVKDDGEVDQVTGFDTHLNTKNDPEKDRNTKRNSSGPVMEKNLMSVTDSLKEQAKPASDDKRSRRKRWGGGVRRNFFLNDPYINMATDTEMGNVYREGAFAESALRWSNRLACKERLNYAVMEEDVDEMGIDAEVYGSFMDDDNAEIFENIEGKTMGDNSNELRESSNCSMNKVVGLSAAVGQSPWKSVMPTATQYRHSKKRCFNSMSTNGIGQDETKCDQNESKERNLKCGSLLSLQGKMKLLKGLQSKRKMFGRIRKKPRRYSCNSCSMKYTKPYLAMHQKHHCNGAIQHKAAVSQPCRKMQPCKYCGRQYAKPYLYSHQREHMRKQEMGLKDYFLSHSVKHKKSETTVTRRASQMKLKRNLIGSENESMSSTVCDGRSKKYQCPECKYQTNWSERWLCHQLVHRQSHNITCDHCSIVFTSMKALKIWHTKNGILHTTEQTSPNNSHEMKKGTDSLGKNKVDNISSSVDFEKIASKVLNKTEETNAEEVLVGNAVGNTRSCRLSATEQSAKNAGLSLGQKHLEVGHFVNAPEQDNDNNLHKVADNDSANDCMEHFTVKCVESDKTESEVVDGGEETGRKERDDQTNVEKKDEDGEKDDNSSRRDGDESSKRGGKDRSDGGDERDKGDDNKSDENNNDKKGTESLQCLICDASFSQKLSLMRHLTKIHRLLNLCPICYFKYRDVKRFSNPVSLRNHKLRHHPEDMVKCVCGTMLIDQTMLTAHLKKFNCNANKGNDNAVSDMVKCSCGKRFGTQQLLLNHKSKCRKRKTIEDIVENLRGDQIKLEPKHARKSASLNTDETYQDVKYKYDQQLQDQPSCSSSSYPTASSSSVATSVTRESGVSGHTAKSSSSASISETANVGARDLKNNDVDKKNSTTVKGQKYKKGKGKVVSEKGKAPAKKKRKKKPDAEGRYPCKTCGRRFKRPYLYVHQKQVHQRRQWVIVPARQKIVKRFQCGWCKYKSVSWGTVLTHHYATHQEHELNIMDLP